VPLERTFQETSSAAVRTFETLVVRYNEVTRQSSDRTTTIQRRENLMGALTGNWHIYSELVKKSNLHRMEDCKSFVFRGQFLYLRRCGD
jgi:hypothetical protein